MSKVALKKAIAIEQDGVDPYNGEDLSTDQSDNDSHRLWPKAKGGTYDKRKNVQVLTPRSHMERHGILRIRTPEEDALKSLFDDRVQMMGLRLKENNQLKAYIRRTDHQNPETKAFLEEHIKPIDARIAKIDRNLTAMLKTYSDKLAQEALKVKGLGPITVAALTIYVDLKGRYTEKDRAVIEGFKRVGQEKAPYPSSLWKYVGLHAASHERYEKGEASGGNKTLRTVLYNFTDVIIKLNEGGYRDVYDRTKLRLSQSDKIVKTYNTEGRLIELPWRETKPSHRDGAARRAMIKHLLVHYWIVGRTLAGLPTPHLYAEAMLGHAHIVTPKECGWEFEG